MAQLGLKYDFWPTSVFMNLFSFTVFFWSQRVRTPTPLTLDDALFLRVTVPGGDLPPPALPAVHTHPCMPTLSLPCLPPTFPQFRFYSYALTNRPWEQGEKNSPWGDTGISSAAVFLFVKGRIAATRVKEQTVGKGWAAFVSARGCGWARSGVSEKSGGFMNGKISYSPHIYQPGRAWPLALGFIPRSGSQCCCEFSSFYFYFLMFSYFSRKLGEVLLGAAREIPFLKK